MSLCVLCTNITLLKMRGPHLDQMLPHQPSYLALRRSAENGCQLCHFFWLALEQGTGHSGKDGVNRTALAHVSERFPGRQISLVAWGGSGNASNLDHINIITTGEIPSATDSEDDDAPADRTMHPEHQVALSGVVSLYAYQDDPAAWRGGVSGRPLPCNAGDSQEDFDLVSKWLADCLDNHSQCRKLSPDTRLPSRVIDVGPPDGAVEPFLMESCGRTGLYTTLSHCWGGEVPLTTTTTTLESRKECIPFMSLPRTFQDAVKITRKLRVCYLWIDSLCIVQDSRHDWEKESTLMGEVYASGYLNIAARGATNARSGCFLSRELEPPACCLTYESPDKSLRGSIYIRDPSYRTERLKDAPLDQRGWVLQERLLAPRIAHYGRQQLYWECSEVTIRQDGKHYDVTTDDLRAGVNFKQSLDFNATGPFSSIVNPAMLDDQYQLKQSKAARFLQWYNVVAEYSTRSLTFSTDKLLAIAGIAKAFHMKFNATYIAGLWKEDLIAGLAWTLGSSGGEAESETLPSWSWARWKGDVRFWSQTIGLPLRLLDDACSLISVECTALSPTNPYGDVYAKLYVRGRILLVTYTRPSGSLDDYLETTVFAMDGRSIGRVAFDSCHHPLDTFSCFLIHGGSDYPVALALKSDSGCTGRFRRVGYVSVHSRKNQPDGRNTFMEVDPQIICLV